MPPKASVATISLLSSGEKSVYSNDLCTCIKHALFIAFTLLSLCHVMTMYAKFYGMFLKLYGRDGAALAAKVAAKQAAAAGGQ